MSTVEQPQLTANAELDSLSRTVARNRVSIACAFAAAIISFAAFACTTIPTRDSILDPFTLQVLVSLLSSIAASLLLIASGVRQEKWHFRAWALVFTGWFLIIVLT